MFVGIKSSKSQATKTTYGSENGLDARPERRSPFAGIGLHSGKKFFKFDTATPSVNGNLFEAEPFEHVAPTFSIDVTVDTDWEKQKKILLKVKSMKQSITKLFKPTNRISVTVPCVDHSFVVPNFERSTTTDHSSLSFPPVLHNTKPNAVYGGSVVDERVEDTPSLRGTDGSLSSASWFSMETESQPDISHSVFDPGELSTIEEEDGSAREVVGVTNTRQELANSYSGLTIYLSVDTLFERLTQDESGLVSSELKRSPAETSLATSVDREDSFHSLPGGPRKLRKMQSYEDLRGLRVIRCHDLRSAMSCRFSGCPCNLQARSSSGINAAPLRRSKKHDNLRESFLSLDPKLRIPAPLTRMRKYKMFQVRLSTRFGESSGDKEKTFTSPNPRETSKSLHGCWLLRGVLHPSSRVRARVLGLPQHQSPQTSLPPVWSCAKITRSRLKASERRKVTKWSMKRLKARLDSMGLDPWY